MKTLLLVLAFFRLGGGLDFASMGSGLTGGILGMSNAHELPDPNFNIPGAGTEADSDFMGALRKIIGDSSANSSLVDPALRQAFQALMGIDMSGLIGAGQQAGQQYGDLAQLSQMYSGQLGQQAQAQFGAGQDIYNLGRDPQNQLHDYMQQQNIDQSRAASSARGIGMGANAAGLENDASRNFEMNWQNNLLNRASTGLQGMGQANYMGGMDLSNSLAMGGLTPGYTMSSAQAPIGAQQAAYGSPMDYSNAFMGAENQGVLGPQYNIMGAVNPYIGMAQQGQIAQFNATMGRDIASNNMQQQSQYGMWGGGQSGTNTMSGNQSGAGNPTNWMGMGGGMSSGAFGIGGGA